MIDELFSRVRRFFLGPERADLSYLPDDPFLREIATIAFDKLLLVDEDPQKLDEPFRSIVLIVSAQNIFDARGIRGFFSEKWPLLCDYNELAGAYASIGQKDLAAELCTAISSFPFPDPEERLEDRQHYIRQHTSPHTGQVSGWTNTLHRNSNVYPALSTWAKQQLTS